MKEVNFETMLRGKSADYIVVGKGLERLINNNVAVRNIRTQLPMAYERIKRILHRELDCIQIIEFWKEVKIYKIVY